MQDPTSVNAAIGRVELAITALRAKDASDMTALSAAWADLVPLITPEAGPATRACAHCGNTVMAAATRCGFCWKGLTPKT